MFALRQSIRPAFRAGARFNSTVAAPRTSSSAKGVLFGFFAGATLSGFACYYFLMEEYKATSNAVVADVLRLQRSVDDLDKHITNIELQQARAAAK